MHATNTHPFRIHTVDADASVRTLSQPFDEDAILTPESQQYFDHLIAAMVDFQGIGIAACQIGDPVSVIVIEKDYVDDEYLLDDNHLVLINPRIVTASGRSTIQEEGCLSVPGIYGPIERASKIRIKALQRNGQPIDIKAKGMFARILQHEMDHLFARVFIDNAISTHRAF